jgi:hypothetical protein
VNARERRTLQMCIRTRARERHRRVTHREIELVVVSDRQQKLAAGRGEEQPRPWATRASAPPVSMHLPTHARHRLRLVPLQSGAQEDDSVDRMEAKGCPERRTQDTSKQNGSCARTQRQRRAKTHVQWREELSRVQDNNPRLDRPQNSPRPLSAPEYTASRELSLSFLAHVNYTQYTAHTVCLYGCEGQIHTRMVSV